MSDRDALTPRVFLARHGATEWAKSGRFTGTTDIDLAPEGTAQVSSTASLLVGPGRLVDPSRLARVIVSPRKRARRTFELLMEPSLGAVQSQATWEVIYTEDVAEWDYGNYEGLKANEIRLSRKARGMDLDREWDIWGDGCEGGESMDQITRRLDRVIMQIRQIQGPYMQGQKPADVLIVAHGLILRCFVKRWLGLAVDANVQMMLAPGAIAVLSYKDNDIAKPAFHVGLALPPAN